MVRRHGLSQVSEKQSDSVRSREGVSASVTMPGGKFGPDPREKKADPTAPAPSPAKPSRLFPNTRAVQELTETKLKKGASADDTEEDEGDPDGDEVVVSTDPVEYEEFVAMGIDPVKPTAAKPGSENKVLMLMARYAAGIPLWHDKDCYDHGTGEGDGAFLSLAKTLPPPDSVESDD